MNQILEYLFPTKTKAKVITKPVCKPTPPNVYDTHSGVSGLATTGYYTDLSATPVGNRPVYGSYAKYSFPVSRVNLKNGKFNCVQPLWEEDCK